MVLSWKTLKVLGKSVGLCKTSKRKDQLYISLLLSVWKIICENFNPNGLIMPFEDIKLFRIDFSVLTKQQLE